MLAALLRGGGEEPGDLSGVALDEAPGDEVDSVREYELTLRAFVLRGAGEAAARGTAETMAQALRAGIRRCRELSEGKPFGVNIMIRVSRDGTDRVTPLINAVIEEGVKLDNLIQIAHNVVVGAHSAIAACTGIAGSVTAARAISGQSGMGVMYELDAIAMAVIGGVSLSGGRGSIVGSVLGALIVGVCNTGLSLAGVDDYWQMFAAGTLVIIAVALDQWLRRASQ